MPYPDYPNNRLIVNGIDLTTRFRLILVDGYELNPPEPKTYTVDIPGGDGVIDLTESLSGDVSYENRSQKFSFALMNMKGINDTTIQEFERIKTQLSNFLHGKSFDYQLTMDPGYTYHGRFTIESYGQTMYSNGRLGAIVINIDAEPYKSKGVQSYKLNAVGGRLFRLESGRKPVHPTIECSQPVDITFGETFLTVPAGTHRINDVLFRQGFNEIYINSYHFWNITWSEIDEDGSHEMTWGDAESYRWDDIQRLGGDVEESTWEDVAIKRWNDLGSTTWNDINQITGNNAVPEAYVYLTYDWKDL